MTINIDIPREIEQALLKSGQSLSDALKEAACVELYRMLRINHSQFATALGLSRDQADGVLKRHGVMLATTAEEVMRDAEALRKLGAA